MSRHPDVSAATRRNPAAAKPAKQAVHVKDATGSVGSRKTMNPKPHYGKTAKKAENDDRPLRHGKVQKSHKKRQILEQQKI